MSLKSFQVPLEITYGIVNCFIIFRRLWHKKVLSQFFKLSKIRSAIVRKNTGQCFCDVTKENLHISRTRLFQKKLTNFSAQKPSENHCYTKF